MSRAHSSGPSSAALGQALRGTFWGCTDLRAQGSLEPTSPRSVEACLRLGIEPHELHYVPAEVFAQELGARDLGAIAFKHHEAVRQVHQSCMRTLLGRGEAACPVSSECAT